MHLRHLTHPFKKAAFRVKDGLDLAACFTAQAVPPPVKQTARVLGSAVSYVTPGFIKTAWKAASRTTCVLYFASGKLAQVGGGAYILGHPDQGSGFLAAAIPTLMYTAIRLKSEWHAYKHPKPVITENPGTVPVVTDAPDSCVA
jgi:hypothetical protein